MSTLLVDGDNLLSIGFHGMKNFFYKGNHIGGIFHFLNSLRKSLDEYNLKKICVFWDGEDSHLQRKKLYSYYKENRRIRVGSEIEKESYDFQRLRVKQYIEEFYARQCEFSECEADDCISFYIKNSPMEDKIIYSSDCDFYQLLNENTKIYNPHHRKLYGPKNLIEYNGEEVLVENVSIIKILCGDNSDNIAGIRNLGIKKLIKMVPELSETPITLDEIKSKFENLLVEDKHNNLLKNILSGTSKYGVFGEEFFFINEKIIDLKNIFLTQEAIDGINDMINEKMDSDGRSYRNIIKMMMEDGIFNLLPKHDNKWLFFLNPFLKLTRIEKNKKIN